MFVLVYVEKEPDTKRYRARRYCLPKVIINNCNVIINSKKFVDQPINFGTKRNKEMKKLTAGQSEYYTTGCLLDYEYIRNHYEVIAVDTSRQKELNSFPESIK